MHVWPHTETMHMHAGYIPDYTGQSARTCKLKFKLCAMLVNACQQWGNSSEQKPIMHWRTVWQRILSNLSIREVSANLNVAASTV